MPPWCRLQFLFIKKKKTPKVCSDIFSNHVKMDISRCPGLLSFSFGFLLLFVSVVEKFGRKKSIVHLALGLLWTCNYC